MARALVREPFTTDPPHLSARTPSLHRRRRRCTSKFVLPPTCVGVHDRPVVWSGVRMRGYPPRCVTSKSIRLDEFCDACQGRVETVLDRFSHGQVVGTTEHFARVSSRIEPARLLRFTRTCGILDFPVFEKKIRVPFDFVSLFHTADKIERNCHAALSV